jgi:hypothetical protein
MLNFSFVGSRGCDLEMTYAPWFKAVIERHFQFFERVRVRYVGQIGKPNRVCRGDDCYFENAIVISRGLQVAKQSLA